MSSLFIEPTCAISLKRCEFDLRSARWHNLHQFGGMADAPDRSGSMSGKTGSSVSSSSKAETAPDARAPPRRTRVHFACKS